MEWLIVSMLIVAGIIYLLLQRLDRLTGQRIAPSGPPSSDAAGKQYALVLGDSPLAESLLQLLKKHQIDCLQIKDESSLDKTKQYHQLFAVSNDDLSNMLVSIILNQLSESCMTIAVCNSSPDRRIFEQNNIPYVTANEADANTLFHILYPALSI